MDRFWYDTPEGRLFLDSTFGGRFTFVWEALLKDGSSLRQFDEVAWDRSMNDPDFVPPNDLRLSTDIIPRDRVVRFTLFPIAKTKRDTPWFQIPISMAVDPNTQKLLAYWLVDRNALTQKEVCRHVIGYEDRATGGKTLTVISPSGSVMRLYNVDNDDFSYEGE